MTNKTLNGLSEDELDSLVSSAAAVGILSRRMSAVFLPAEGILPDDDRYAAFASIFAGCDLLIVEGDS